MSVANVQCTSVSDEMEHFTNVLVLLSRLCWKEVIIVANSNDGKLLLCQPPVLFPSVCSLAVSARKLLPQSQPSQLQCVREKNA